MSKHQTCNIQVQVEFPDEHVDEGMVSGTMTLHLPKVENVKSGLVNTKEGPHGSSEHPVGVRWPIIW